MYIHDYENCSAFRISAFGFAERISLFGERADRADAQPAASPVADGGARWKWRRGRRQAPTVRDPDLRKLCHDPVPDVMSHSQILGRKPYNSYIIHIDIQYRNSKTLSLTVATRQYS